MPPSNTQNISAGKELLTAVRLYSSGLGQLQELDDGTSDFFHLPLWERSRNLTMPLCSDLLIFQAS
jgi:hypothetical protein